MWVNTWQFWMLKYKGQMQSESGRWDWLGHEVQWYSGDLHKDVEQTEEGVVTFSRKMNNSAADVSVEGSFHEN